MQISSDMRPIHPRDLVVQSEYTRGPVNMGMQTTKSNNKQINKTQTTTTKQQTQTNTNNKHNNYAEQHKQTNTKHKQQQTNTHKTTNTKHKPSLFLFVVLCSIIYCPMACDAVVCCDCPVRQASATQWQLQERIRCNTHCTSTQTAQGDGVIYPSNTVTRLKMSSLCLVLQVESLHTLTHLHGV